MKEKLQNCQGCDLADTRTQVVLPRGNERAKIMFVGEAPGRQEDEIGKPFVGQAGKWFEAALEILDLTVADYYLTNTVKCRPVNKEGGNRPPSESEIISCCHWLKEEIEMVDPHLIVIMGGTALKVFSKELRISDVAGEELHGHKITKNEGRRLFVLFHPAVLIYNQKYYKPIFKRGLENLRRIIDEGDFRIPF